jgi:hypothetical protein
MMTALSIVLHEVFATVRQTAAAHASALDELERMTTAATATALHEVFATVRQTAAAHASALDELDRAFAAQTVNNESTGERSDIIFISWIKKHLQRRTCL